MTKYASCVTAIMAVQLITVAAAVVPQFLFGAPPLPNYSGLWVETRPHSGPAMRLKLTQQGSQIEVRLSYRNTFGDKVSGVAEIQNNNTATWTSPQGCDPRFQKPGYNYDNPGENLFSLRLDQLLDGSSSEPVLLYTEETRWNVPCDSHPIGTERISKALRRASANQ